jgi:signal transduction histidine kinase
MGELASGVAHEIRNPLNTISTITQQLNKDFKPLENSDEYYTLTNLVNKEIKRINKTVQDFLRFSRPEKISLQKFELAELIDQIQAQYNSLLKEKNISFNKSVEWNGIVNWDRNQIQQVIMNLMQNSIDAITEAGEITFKIKEFNNRINIKIRDNGSGIPEHIQNKIFNLYYTTKASGTGIGLSIIQRIIFEHNGTLEFESEENIGTTFIIRLPINSANNL